MRTILSNHIQVWREKIKRMIIRDNYSHDLQVLVQYPQIKLHLTNIRCKKLVEPMNSTSQQLNSF